ncbi:DUF4347 domain-containing protein [Geobacter sp. SVR]|uniref:DUF4347 domain-containing protein n=1 Tax=Geobacter sp. SVR TaxID=2495594 RepID=UPI00143EF7D7|nr:DUF4347 domain-containing protein [Geobacter sp. SVR]BCS55103.1 hypothetical protein GSVR_34110 [Geobacter sp. SVR]GCF85284.1 hypothetical protein GSbR_18840 [Geobacter sp. SVR]
MTSLRKRLDILFALVAVLCLLLGALPAGAAVGRHEVVFIDAAVQDAQALADGIRPGVEVVRLDAGRDGSEQMSEVLAHRRNLQAIHVISHGGDGEIQLGTLKLSNTTINDKKAALAAIGQALVPGGDLLIYGCNVAKSASGKELISSLAKITKANVAASSNNTGGLAGADWVLEYATAPVSSPVAIASTVTDAYRYNLTAPYSGTIDFDNNGTIINAGGGIPATLASYSIGGYLLTATDNGDIDIFDAGSGSGNELLFGTSTSDATNVVVKFSNDEVFNIASLRINVFPGVDVAHGQTPYNAVYTISGYNGSTLVSSVNTNTLYDPGYTVNYANSIQVVTLNFTNITKFTISRYSSNAPGTGIGCTIDNLVVSNVHAAATHTVTFDANGGSGSMTVQTSGSATALTSNSFTRTGYAFAGWNTVSGGGGTAYANGASYGFGADVTLYAQWTAVAAAPTVTTQAVSSIAATTATANGNITSLGSPNPTQYGVVWNTSTGPTTANSKTTQGAIAATGAFTSSMTGLSPNTTYYVRAYATNTAGTSYGTEVSFTTSGAAPTITSATYDASTNALTVTATGMTTSDTINTTKLTLTGEGGNTYTLAGSYTVTASNATSFSVTLDATDQLNIRGLLNKNGATAAGGTTYNLAGAAGWDSTQSAPADLTGNGVTVSNVQTPTITSATYDAGTGVLVVTGANLVKQPGATNDIDVTKLALTGQGGSVTLTGNTANVEITSATSFSVTLGSTDKAAVNAKLDKNGTSSTGSVTYNLAAADDWNGPITGGSIADTTGNGVTVSGVVTTPNVQVYYISSDGNGSTLGATDALNRINSDGSGDTVIASSINPTPGDLALDVANNRAFFIGATTTSASQGVYRVDLTTGVVSTIKSLTTAPSYGGIAYDSINDYVYYIGSDGSTSTLGATDALNRIKPDGSDDTVIASSINPAPGDLALDIANNRAFFIGATGSTPGVYGIDLSSGTVSTIKTLTTAPVYGGIAYDSINDYVYYISSDGVSTLGATDALNRIKPDGSGDTVIASSINPGPGDLALDLPNNRAFFLGAAGSAPGVYSINLSSGAVSTIKTLAAVPAYGGIAVTDGTTPTFDPANSSPVGNATGVSGTANLSLRFSEAVIKGTSGNFVIRDVTANTTLETIAYNDARVTGWGTNTLTIDPTSTLPSGHAVSVQWSAGVIQDYYANFVAANATDTLYDLTIGGSAGPAITSATYDASTNVLTVTATGMSAGDVIDTTKLTLTGEGGNTYTLAGSYTVTASSATSFSVTLNATDQLNVRGLLNKNGTTAAGGTTYNLAGAAGWDSTQSAPADLTGNGVTVSTVQTPTITSATYDAGTGVLVVTGANLVKQPGASNDIDVTKLTLTGQGGSVTLTGNTTNVEITSATLFTVTLGSTDKTAVNAKLDKNGTSSTGSVTYNLAAADDWNGPITGGSIADTTGNGITVSGVATPNTAPVITSLNGDAMAYTAGTGARVIDQGTAVAVTDSDSANFDTGTLTVSVSGATAADVLGIRNQGNGSGLIGVSSGNVTYGGTTIGSFSGGSGSNLVVTFNSNATPTAASVLLANITYSNASAVSATTRSVSFTITDGDGGTSTASTVTISVTPASVGTIYTVTNLNDSGAGSLRQAIIDSNGHTGADTIVFTPGLSGTIHLLSRLDITDSVTIQGPGADVVTIDGASATQFLKTENGDVTTNIKVTITGLAFDHGRMVDNDPDLGYVGAIDNREDLTLSNVIVKNTAVGTQYHDAAFAVSTIASDYATYVPKLTIRNSVITGNAGTAIFSIAAALVDIENSTISNTSFIEGSAGGGLSINGVSSTVIKGSYIAGNSAKSGSALYFSPSNNSSETLWIENSTITGNISDPTGSGAGDVDGALGINASLVTAGMITIKNSTIAGNPGYNGAAKQITTPLGNGTDIPMQITNSIVYYDGTGDVKFSTDQNITASYNVIENVATIDTAIGNVTANPNLVAAAANGGPTETLALNSSSNAINLGAASAPTTDQRGFVRNPASGVDAGAYEYGATQFQFIGQSRPLDGAVNVAVNSGITLDFGSTISAGTGSMRIYNADTNALIETISVASATVSGSRATFTPSSSLPGSTNIYVEVDAGTFTASVDGGTNNAGSVAMRDATGISFKTASASSTYTVTYNGNGNTGGSVPTDSNSYANGATVTVQSNSFGLTRSGYVFAGWNSLADGTGTDYAATGSATFTMGSANRTLYAKWTAVTGPGATTSAATGVGPDSATLNGTVTGSGSWTSVGFEYGTTTSYGSFSNASPRILTTGGATAVTATVTGLSCSTTYHFRVNGQNNGGDLTNGSDLTFTTSACTVPGAPTIGTATAGDTKAVVSFTPPAGTGGSVITGYTVTSSPGNITATGTASPIVVSGLTNGTPYTFTVTATNAPAVAGQSAASAVSNAVTPSASSLGIGSVKIIKFALNGSNQPTDATIQVAATNAVLGAGAFTVTNNANPSATITVTGASYANGVYTLTVSGMNVIDTYTLAVAANGYTTYTNTGVIYGRPSEAGDLDLVNEPNIFTTYTRTLTSDGVVTIGNATYAAGAVLYSGAAYDAIDGNNGNPDNGTVTRLIGIFGKAPSGAACVKTLRTDGTILQVANDSLIDANPNFMETIQGGKAAYDANASNTIYWQTLALLPMYSQIATARQPDNSRILVDPADRFRIIEWYDTVDVNGNCTGTPMDVQRLTVKVEYTGTAVGQTSGSTTSIATQPADASVSVNGTATLTVGASTTSGSLSYQWYSSATNSTSGGSAINGATSGSYSPPTASAGTTYYYCMVTNSAGSTGTSRAAQVVVLAPQTIGTVSFTPASLLPNGTATVSATATSGGAVTFTSLTPSVCSVSGTTVTALTAGVCSIAANQAGNTTYDTAPQVIGTITVAAAANRVHLTHNSATTAYNTIQEAVNASADGDVIALDSGTFIEQVTITTNVTIQGAGIGQTIIQSPSAASLLQNGGTWRNLRNKSVYAIVGIKTVTPGTVTITGLTVDGQVQGNINQPANTYGFMGIAAINSNLTVDGVRITGVRDLNLNAASMDPIPDSSYGATHTSGADSGESIFAESAAGAGEHTLVVRNSTMDDIQKDGILAWGPTLTVDIHDNTIQGRKTFYQSINGIQIGSSDYTSSGGGDRRGTKGSVSNNTILDLGMVIPVGHTTSGLWFNGWVGGSTGILVWEAGNGVTVTGNTITRTGDKSWKLEWYANQGIDFYLSPNPTVSNNTVSGFDYGILEEGASNGSVLTASGNILSANTVDLWASSGNDQITLNNANSEVIGYLLSGNGTDTLTNFGTGDAIYVNSLDGSSSWNFTGGTVTSGNGSNVAAHSVQVSVSGNTTTLYIDTDGNAGPAELQINLVGTYLPANFVLSGAYIQFTKAGQTITFANPGSQTYGTTPTLSASASSGLAPIFTSSTSGVCTITPEGALTLVSGGTCTINANQAGNAYYNAAPQVTQSFTVNQAGQTIGSISFTSSSLTVSGTTTASATATSGGAITFSSLTPSVCTVSGSTVTGIAAGVCTIAADQTGNGGYGAAPQVTKSITVAAAANKIHLIHNTTTTDYTTVQGAVDAAADNDVIMLDAGTFIEQVTITKPLTLQGAGVDQTIIRSPARDSLIQSGGNWKNLKDQDVIAVVGIKTASPGTVILRNLTVDGNDQGYLADLRYPDKGTYTFQGIGAYHTTVTIDTVKVTGVRELNTDYGNDPAHIVPADYLPADQPAGMNHNEGIFAESAAGAGAHTLTVKNSTVTKFQKTAILAWGPTLTVDIDNNTIQGYGKSLWSTGNAIQVGSSDRSAMGGANGDRRGTAGTVTNNRILDIGIVIPEPGQDGSYLNLGLAGPSGVLLWEVADSFRITGNTITGPGIFSWHSNISSNDGGFGNMGINVYKGPNVTISGNTISGFDVGIIEESAAVASSLAISGNTMSNNTDDIWTSAGNDHVSLGSGSETIAFNQSGNGIDTITNFGTGDKIHVIGFTTVGGVDSVNGLINGQPVVDFTGGSVTAGDGSTVAARSVHVSASGNTTTLYVNTDGVSGSQLQITLDGTYTPANFVLNGGYIQFTRINQTITFGNPGNQIYGSGGTLAATTSSNLAVTFTSATPGVCTVSSDGTITFVGTGTCTIVADQTGNTFYNPASHMTQSFIVGKATASVTLGGLSQTYDGTAKSATATTTPAGRTVTFTYDGSSTPPVNAGSYNVAAAINDPNYSGSASGTLVIAKAGQTITFGAAPSIVVGSTGTMSATGGASTSAVSFSSTTPLVCTINGTTVTGIAAGTCIVAADQAGNANYNAAPRVTQTITVGKGSQTITFGAAPSVVVNGIGTLSAVVSSGLTVSYTSVTPTVCTVSGATVTGVAAGTCTIAADQAGDNNYNAAPRVTQNITVGKGSQTIGAIGFTSSTLTVGATVTASATASSGLGVTFSSLTPGVCSVSGSTVTGITAGICTIAASQAGDANYNAPTQVTQNITVGKGSQTIGAIGFTPSTLTVGSTVTASATVSSGLTVAFASTTPAVCTVSGTTVTGVSPGTCTITATQTGNSDYTSATISQTLTVAYGTNPPLLTVSALSDGATTTDTTQNISGVATDPAGIRSLTINGTTVQVNADGSFSFPVQLLAGANTVTVVVTNKAGITTTDTRTITLDSTAPRLSVTYPPDNAVAVQQSVTVTGTIESLFSGGSSKTAAKTAAATVDPTLVVTWSANGSAPQTASLTDTTYSFTTSLGTGMNTIKVFAANAAGQKVEAKRTVSYQPAFYLAVTDPAADIRTALGSYTLTGNVTDNTTPVSVTITMDGQTYTPAVTNGVFSQTLNFSEAQVYQVAVTGTDQNSNSLTVQRNIIYTVPKAASGSADSTPFTIVDALQALQMSVGIITPDAGQITRMDVAPMVNGVSVGDGKVDIEDAVVILRMVVGLIR